MPLQLAQLECRSVPAVLAAGDVLGHDEIALMGQRVVLAAEAIANVAVVPVRVGDARFPMPADRFGDVKNLPWAASGDDSEWIDLGAPEMIDLGERLEPSGPVGLRDPQPSSDVTIHARPAIAGDSARRLA